MNKDQFTHHVVCPYCAYEYADPRELLEGENDCTNCGHAFLLTRYIFPRASRQKNAPLPVFNLVTVYKTVRK